MSPAVMVQVVMATGAAHAHNFHLSLLPSVLGIPHLLLLRYMYRQHVHVSHTWQLEAGTDGTEDLHSLALASCRTSPCDWHSSRRIL